MTHPWKPVIGSSSGIVSGPVNIFRAGTLRVGSDACEFTTSVEIASIVTNDNGSILMNGHQIFLVRCKDGKKESSFRGSFLADLTPTSVPRVFAVSETVTISSGADGFDGAAGELRFNGIADFTKGTWSGTTSGAIRDCA